MLETLPQESIALVVGIDHYRYGEDWQLHGPAADALRCVDWLLGRGVPRANVALFLSAESWDTDDDVIAWAAKHAWIERRHATRNAISSFIDMELLAVDEEAKALFVFWGGHGVVDDFDNANYLYAADAVGGAPYCISVPNLMRALRGGKFSRLGEQVLVVDACANAFSDTAEAALAGVANIVPTPIDNGIHQFRMFAASPGQQADDLSERRTGRFTESLMAALRADTREGWPDFTGVFEQTRNEVVSATLGQQRPFMAIQWPGLEWQSPDGLPGRASRVASLLALIRQQAGATPELLRRFYLRSLPDANRALDDAPLDAWLLDLQDQRPRNPNHPSPLVQFGERLARKLDSAALRKWVDEQTRDNVVARTAMRSALDEEAALRRPRAMVFIEVDARTQKELHWWIHAPEPRDCSKPQSLPFDIARPAETAASLSRIAAEAHDKAGGRYELVFGMILPDNLLLSQLESVEVVLDDDGLPGVPIALNRRFPVTFHWQRRARAPVDSGGLPITAWRRAVGALGLKLDKGGGANVVWIDAGGPGAAAATLLKGNGICIGLGHAVAGVGEVTPKEIIGCLREGVPCFFWLANPPKGRAAATRKALCGLFAQQEAREAPVSIGELLKQAKDSDPLSSIRIVWDEPGHLPFIPGFANPPHASTGTPE